MGEEEKAMLLEHLFQEALQEPMDYFSHDTDTFDDEALWQLFDLRGYEGLGKFWRLVELLSGRKGHVYRLNDRRLAHDLYLPADEVSQLLTDLVGFGLLDQEAYERGWVSSRRVQKNAERYAEKASKARLGSEITNRKRLAKR